LEAVVIFGEAPNRLETVAASFALQLRRGTDNEKALASFVVHIKKYLPNTRMNELHSTWVSLCKHLQDSSP
jgi:hypothetical protein